MRSTTGSAQTPSLIRHLILLLIDQATGSYAIQRGMESTYGVISTTYIDRKAKFANRGYLGYLHRHCSLSIFPRGYVWYMQPHAGREVGRARVQDSCIAIGTYQLPLSCDLSQPAHWQSLFIIGRL
jgi:hypothetical protein